MVLRAHHQQPGPVVGQRQSHRRRHADADRQHQRTAPPVARHHQTERRRAGTARPSGSATGPRTPCARIPLPSPAAFASSSSDHVASAGTPASAGRRHPGSATRDPRRPRRPDARRRRACPPSSRLTPTSTTAAPGLTMSAVTMCGTPTAAMMTSACRVSAGRSRVPVWHNVTVAFSDRRVSSRPIGRPTVTPRPITTTCAPAIGTSNRRSRCTMPRGVHGSGAGSLSTSRPRLVGCRPSASLAGSMRSSAAFSSRCLGSGSCTM